MITLLAVVFVFGLLIMGHEFGHYIVAKLSNIKVNEFSFGMGPRILKFGRGETEYSWRVFPIGGFVKMLGEEEQINDPRSFSQKPTIVKMAVIIAGPLMNILISILIFSTIAMSIGYVKPIVANFATPQASQQGFNYPAKDSGILPGDKIVEVNGKNILTYEDFLMFMYENKGNPLNLTVLRQSEKIKISITPVLDPSEQRYMIGIEPTFAKATISEGFKYGFLNSWSFIKQIAGFFKSLITGNASTEDVSGPVGIIKFTGEAAKQGFSSLLVFTAFLSINLAILNLVPFPALDGGWLLILFIEGIRRKKLDANKIGILNFVGFAFLMLLTVIVTFRDFIRLNIF